MPYENALPHEDETPIILSLEEKKNLILQSLEEAKAEEIVLIPLQGKSDVADYFICASGLSPRHLKSMADKIVDLIEEVSLEKPTIEGATDCFWVLIDAGDIMVHLFRPEVREFYAIEKLWASIPAG